MASPVILLLVFVAALGCGRAVDRQVSVAPTNSGVASGEPGHTPQATGEGRENAGAGPEEDGRPAEPKGSTRVVEWLRNFTPSGGSGPDGNATDSAYANLMQGDCQGAWEVAADGVFRADTFSASESLRRLYRSAAAACLAAFHGRRDLWAEAHEWYNNIDPGSFSCWDRLVHEFVRSMIDVHLADADALFVRGGNTRSGCPELKGLRPNSGPREGGYQVEVLGRNLPDSLDMVWEDGAVLTARRAYQGGPLLFTVPPEAPDGDGFVLLGIAGGPRIEVVLADFRYLRTDEIVPPHGTGEPTPDVPPTTVVG
ncbi:hypothetical protein [Catenuloplanes japonicus]|uniref:hypothetical protein n=1 Tax=Catenuloplanes japonicus TaxID=33876 RepID=UPI000A93FF94|nr:hypothetical protein [Catenuloplanes japonicus]